jgi:hypothetical protein
VSDYGLDVRAIGVRSPAGAEDFSSSLCVQTGSGAHPASCTMGTGGPFPGGKARPGRDVDHSPPSSAEVVSRSFTSSPSKRLLYFLPTTLGVQSLREIISGGTRTKKVEYHCLSRSVGLVCLDIIPQNVATFQIQQHAVPVLR